MARNPINGPIPGENYLGDTKNFPWHRPPEHTDLDKAIENAMEKLTSEEGAYGILTMLELGVDVASLTDMFITSGIGGGKWTVDMGILLAGPVSHIICLMAKGYGIEYDLGLDTPNRAPTKPYFETLKKINEEKATKVGEQVAEQLPMIQAEGSESAPKGEGFMSVNKPEEGAY